MPYKNEAAAQGSSATRGGRKKKKERKELQSNKVDGQVRARAKKEWAQEKTRAEGGAV